MASYFSKNIKNVLLIQGIPNCRFSEKEDNACSRKQNFGDTGRKTERDPAGSRSISGSFSPGHFRGPDFYNGLGAGVFGLIYVLSNFRVQFGKL